ncbi:MAG: methionyl-tRNA formyltransferase [Acidimicrobiales bacterium]
MIAPPTQVRRVVYLGTPALAVRPLEALVEAGFGVALVVTAPDKRRGRGSDVTPSPVKAAATELGIPVAHDVADVLDVGADLGVGVASGKLISTEVLDELAMVNLHFSLLPSWRGAAPVERAILAGDPRTGVCLMEVAPELDSGGVYRSSEVTIGDKTLEELRSELVEVGAALLVEALTSGLGDPAPQVGEVSYASKIDPAELELLWDRPAVELERVVRLEGAYTSFRGDRLKIWSVALDSRTDLEPGEMDGVVVGTGRGALELIEVQAAGKPRRRASDWANGARLASQDRLGGERS